MLDMNDLKNEIDEFIPKNFKEKMDIKLKVAHLIDSIRDKSPVDTIVHTKKMAQEFKKQNSDLFNEIYSKGIVLL